MRTETTANQISFSPSYFRYADWPVKRIEGVYFVILVSNEVTPLPPHLRVPSSSSTPSEGLKGEGFALSSELGLSIYITHAYRSQPPGLSLPKEYRLLSSITPGLMYYTIPWYLTRRGFETAYV